ncbi:MAG TPA: TolC family protein [Azospirillaceae bacterium]|nr:TolC family protein [Azospirillaceae bacterium]
MPVTASRRTSPVPAARRTAALLALALLAGCAVKPDPIAPSEHLRQAQEDRAHLFDGQEPVSGPIAIEEAVARAIRYNLDHRLALMERAMQDSQLGLANIDLLPRFAASAGYNLRNNTNASSSRSILSGLQSLEPSTSQDKGRGSADLTFTWNILDFGLSYFQAKQQADRVLVTEERRRRVLNNVVQEVRGAFWQAASAEMRMPAIDAVLAEAEAALANAQRVEQEKLRPLVEILQYQKGLLELTRQLRALKTDLMLSRARLAALMNIPQDQPFTLVMPAEDSIRPPDLPADIERLELVALFNRPELREERYQARITRQEAHKALIRMFPALAVTGSLNWDSNSFLVNETWAEAGARATWNLIGLLSGPRGMDVAEAQKAVGDIRRKAMTMAVITQVNVAYRQYRRSQEEFQDAVKLDRIEQRIFQTVTAGQNSEARSELDRIRSSTTAIAAQLQRDRSLADMQTALGNIYASLGANPVPELPADVDLKSLAAAVRTVQESWARGEMPELPALAPAPAS